MLQVVLVAPQIANNTGAIIRLCANSGATLHLVEPLGFSLDSTRLKRAGLDYHELADVHLHRDLDACFAALDGTGRRFALSGRGSQHYDRVRYEPGDVVVFGREQSGLSTAELDRFTAEHRLAIPMRPGNRSLNLANAVSVVVYEAWRQHDFTGASTPSARTGTIAETTHDPPTDPP